MTIIDLSVRDAKPADPDEIPAIHNEAWLHTYRGIIPGAVLNRMVARRSPSWWHESINRGTGLRVLTFGDDIAGYASIRRNLHGGRQVMGEICELYLKPEYQGTGLGARLFEDVRGVARQKYGGGCIVWALRDNERACDFYRHMGGRDAATSVDRFGGVALEKIAFVWE